MATLSPTSSKPEVVQGGVRTSPSPLQQMLRRNQLIYELRNKVDASERKK